MSSILLAIGILAALCSVVLFFAVFGLSYLIDYEPGPRGINFIVFRSLTVFVLKYDRIAECETRKFFDFSWYDGRPLTLLLTLTIGGWPRLTRVMLKTKDSLFRYIFLFPRNPTEFAREVNAYLTERQEQKLR